MVDIEKQAIITFQKNYKFFSTSHPALYEKIDVLQKAIEAQAYQENYALEYINGYFDIKELRSEQFLYGTNSSNNAEKTAAQVNLKKNESVIETSYNFPYTQANIDDLDKLTIINSWMTGTAPIVSFVNERKSSSQEMEKIYKFIFFGVGIGKHITSIHKKIQAEAYFIIEDNLELFRLSLFVTDYEALGKKAKLFFAIMSNPSDFKTNYNLFAEYMFIYNSHLKFQLLSDSYSPKIKQIQNFAVTKSNLLYPYNYLLHKNVLVSYAIHENYNFLNISKPFGKTKISDKPFLYLAAGPSLNVHMQWIKENQEKFIIISVFMIAAKLEDAGICPDIIVHVDEAEEPVESTLKKMKDRSFLKESIFILAASAPLSLLEPLSEKDKIFLIEDRTRYKKDHGFIEFFSVGEVGYALSLIFSIQDIYLLGLDLALDQKTGKTHAQGHSTLDKVDISRGDVVEEMATVRDTLLSVRGNKQDIVLTTPVFDTSIYQVNHFTSLYKQKGQKVYNLGEGAYFDLSSPLDVKNVKCYSIDKPRSKKELLSLLKEKSTNHLSDIEKNNIIIRKKEVKKKVKLIERFKKQNIKRKEDFTNQLTSLAEDLSLPVVVELNEVSEIFLNYFQTIGGYIGNFINSKNGNDLSAIKKLQEVMSRQLYKILHDIGSFEFNYLNGKKYFDTGNYEALKGCILNFNLVPQTNSQIQTLYFLQKVLHQHPQKDKEKDIVEKIGIGFLAIDENLKNIHFMEYIKKLLSKFPDEKFKVFYFDDNKEVAKALLLDYKKQLNFVELIDIEVLIFGMTVFTYPITSTYNKKIALKIREYNSNTFTLGYDVSLSGILKDKDLDKDNIQVIENKRFKHSLDELKSSNYNIPFLNISKALHSEGIEKIDIDKNRSWYELYHYDMLAYALKYESFRKYYYYLRNISV